MTDLVEDFKGRGHLIKLFREGSVGLELGVQGGEHARHLLTCRPGQLHLIDIWQHQIQHGREEKGRSYVDYWEDARQLDRNPAVTIHDGFGRDVIPGFADRFFDWVYIDANHDYEAVVEDIRLCLPKIKDGGIISGHDFCVIPSGDKTGSAGVVRAVTEELLHKGLKMIGVGSFPYPDWAVRVDHSVLASAETLAGASSSG